MLVVVLLVRQFPVTNFTEESPFPGFIWWSQSFIVFDGPLGSGSGDIRFMIIVGMVHSAS